MVHRSNVVILDVIFLSKNFSDETGKKVKEGLQDTQYNCK